MAEQNLIFCNACQVQVDIDLKNAHYNTEWHRYVWPPPPCCPPFCHSTPLALFRVSRYNVKRKCAQLPPVPRTLFETKVAALQQAATAPTVETSLKCKVCKCVPLLQCCCVGCGVGPLFTQPCPLASCGGGDETRKSFHTEAQFQQHIETKKHKAMAVAAAEVGLVDDESDALEAIVTVKKPVASSSAAAGAVASSTAVRDDAEDDSEGADDADVDDEDREPIPPTVCLFCSLASASLAENVAHMTDVHCFYVPCTRELNCVLPPHGGCRGLN